MEKKKSTEGIIATFNELKKKTGDLTMDEDLSIAVMNLISIEEHLYYTGMKTNKEKYFKLLLAIREIRKKFLKEIIGEAEGELWCISKHLLAASMRLIEAGNKHLAKKEEERAYEKYYDSFYLYSLFWEINFKVTENNTFIRVKDKRYKEKIVEKIKKVIDCCKE